MVHLGAGAVQASRAALAALLGLVWLAGWVWGAFWGIVRFLSMLGGFLFLVVVVLIVLAVVRLAAGS